MTVSQDRHRGVRRQLFAVMATAIVSLLVGASAAPAADNLVAVEWGGKHDKAAQRISAGQSDATIQWVLHQGSAAAILAKIRAAWPNVPYDLVAAFNPVFATMIAEDWVETLTPEKVPALKNIPDNLMMRDTAGNIKAVPRTTNATFWAYRKDTCPIEIKKMDDLLDPKLKGKVLVRNITMGTGSQVAVFARAFGGDERNLEPGWDFVKKLAKSGNIGRVAHSDQDILNSLTSGETCVALASISIWERVKESFPVVPLTKLPKETGLMTILTMEGWAVIKKPNTDAAMKWLNYMLKPEHIESFNAEMGGLPSNKGAKVDSKLSYVDFGNDMDKYAVTPDWGYLATKLPENTKRWETEIVPQF